MTMVVGSILLLPTDLILLGKSIIATMLFGSNILFWRTSGYFDGGVSEINPILHTWSLAVEEQFYIGLPLLLILIFSYARRWLKPILWIAAITSFAVCIKVQGYHPTAVFYLSPFRAWELLVGSLLAINANHQIRDNLVRELIAWLGLVLLISSIVLIRSGVDFPGWQASIPVLGTALILHAGSAGTTQVGALLSIRPMIWVGLISFSLYLWHWPVLVFMRYLNALEPLKEFAWVGLIISFGLSALSYRYIETPFRNNKKYFSYPRLIRLSAVACGFLILTSVGIWLSKGLPQRI
jgi:peptidoglycan/LPS O-acetylase OafA/YrhL